jgi:hypothetical protein
MADGYCRHDVIRLFLVNTTLSFIPVQILMKVGARQDDDDGLMCMK